MNVELKKLTAYDGRDVYDFLQTLPKDENGFINSAAGVTFEEFKHWCARCAESAEKTEIEDGWKVPQTTYWLYAEGKPVGMGKLRHALTDSLRVAGGHIGYAISPTERNRGYGKLLLKLLLREAAGKGIEQALVTIHNDNKASIRVAMSCDGTLEKVTEDRHIIWLDTRKA
ncbi:MAG: GNAT family N-acetyltransferase [Clostridiales bacterium]|nr:GNAT family N-acetyltransferase [Clostridiales bacterium]